MGTPCFSRESEALHEFGLYNKDFIITKLNSNELAEKINIFLKKDKQEINEILGNLMSIVHRDFNIDNSDKYFLKISNIFSII